MPSCILAVQQALLIDLYLFPLLSSEFPFSTLGPNGRDAFTSKGRGKARAIDAYTPSELNFAPTWPRELGTVYGVKHESTIGGLPEAEGMLAITIAIICIIWYHGKLQMPSGKDVRATPVEIDGQIVKVTQHDRRVFQNPLSLAKHHIYIYIYIHTRSLHFFNQACS